MYPCSKCNINVICTPDSAESRVSSVFDIYSSVFTEKSVLQPIVCNTMYEVETWQQSHRCSAVTADPNAHAQANCQCDDTN